MAAGWANLAWGGLGGAAFNFAQMGIQYPLDSPTNTAKFANKTLYPDGWRSAMSFTQLSPHVGAHLCSWHDRGIVRTQVRYTWPASGALTSVR